MTLILCLAFFLVAVALALRDPVEALLRYGTPADAARLPIRASTSARSAFARPARSDAVAA